ncbi:sensor histidine kinase [Brachybacterium sp. P6-10-X1]|uniref:sensor histidine kinase n=1 Tax=Brachybacterium sp. P6-10-X1 TaxID=1903186 RepID=UPI0012FB771D|nr:histidine kinase [Brachybacterium sp. P6-10-X1]
MTAPASASPERAAPRAADVVLALGVALALAGVITIQQAASGAPPSPLAYLFAAGFGALQLLRRSVPVAMLVLSVLATFAYYTLQLPTIGVALPVVAALYSTAERGLLRWAIGAGTVVFTVSLLFRLRDDPQPLGSLLGTDAVTNLALIAAALALGSAVRSHRRQITQRELISQLREERARREAQLRIRRERERISRDLHDTVGHALSVISLHTGVARDAVGTDDDSAARALDHVRGQTTESLQELRSMVRLLREGRADGERSADGADRADRADGADGADRADGADEAGGDVSAEEADDATASSTSDGSPRAVRSLADVPSLLAPARRAGLTVRDRVEVPSGSLSGAVDSAGYRVIQEAVTNALRHAAASTLCVDVRVEDRQLRITVADDGRGADGTDEVGTSSAGGVGLLGMRERVHLLGGTFSARTAPGEGFTVRASLPVRLGAAAAATTAGRPVATEGPTTMDEPETREGPTT